MVNADMAMRFAVSADRLWNMLTGPDMVKVLIETYAEKVEVDEGGHAGGSAFVTTLRGGGVIRERVDFVDNDERCFRYHVLDAGPLPYANYRGEARVQPCGADACVFSLQCTFIAVELSEDEARQHWLDHNREVMQAVRVFLESR